MPRAPFLPLITYKPTYSFKGTKHKVQDDTTSNAKPYSIGLATLDAILHLRLHLFLGRQQAKPS
jgi:hypothetical protein